MKLNREINLKPLCKIVINELESKFHPMLVYLDSTPGMFATQKYDTPEEAILWAIEVIHQVNDDPVKFFSPETEGIS